MKRLFLYTSFGILIFLSAVALGTAVFTYKKPQLIISILEHLLPSPTPTPWVIKGIAVLGDSQSDEYQGDDNRGGVYASTTLNWVEILAKTRNLNVGDWGTRDEPRKAGFEYNWARSGATAYSMLKSGQHIGVAEQVKKGEVNTVIIYIGANDFAPTITPDDYQAIYEGTITDAQILEKINRLVADITTAIDTIKQAGDVRILLVKVPDWANHVGIQLAFPLPHQRQRVTDAIQLTNDRLEEMARDRGIPTADPNAFYQTLINKNNTGKIQVGTHTIYRIPPSNEPNHLFLDDGIHVGTVMNGLYANYLINNLNSKIGTAIRPLSDQEILTIAGL